MPKVISSQILMGSRSGFQMLIQTGFHSGFQMPKDLGSQIQMGFR